jgi:AhpD family alkylhydroperoxidase
MYDKAKLKNLKILGDGAPEAMAAFWAFDKAALADGVVPKKYKELIALGVALTTQCPYCLEIHRAAAEAAGATREELAETALVAAALRAGAAVTRLISSVIRTPREAKRSSGSKFDPYLLILDFTSIAIAYTSG